MNLINNLYHFFESAVCIAKKYSNQEQKSDLDENVDAFFQKSDKFAHHKPTASQTKKKPWFFSSWKRKKKVPKMDGYFFEANPGHLKGPNKSKAPVVRTPVLPRPEPFEVSDNIMRRLEVDRFVPENGKGDPVYL